ncbi:MAG: M20 family metallo-hydrolase [Candidatus Tectomicrobia bacterium]|nr:M20 family metallo-hydrolase [Candidatus Tectomicrobia bacterium]
MGLQRLGAVQRFLQARRGEMIELMRLLTAVPAIGPRNGGEGEWEKARLLVDYLRQAGLGDIETAHAPDASVPAGQRPNVAARLSGRAAAGRSGAVSSSSAARPPATWVVSHLDVVPPGDLSLWEADPYELRTDGDRLIGRGAEDNHQGIVASVFALRALGALGLPPRRTVGIAFVADEETGNQFGISHVLGRGAFFSPGDLVIAPDTGCGAGFSIEVAEKAILQVRCTVRGAQCHSSLPHLGSNSHRAAARLVLALDDLYARFPASDPLFEPPRSTFEPTRHDANIGNINMIPGTDVFYLDCRVLPVYDLDAVLAAMREIAAAVAARAAVEIDINLVQARPSVPAVDEQAPAYQAVRQAVREVAAREPRRIGMGVGTVATYLRQAGYPAVVYCQSDNSGHQPNEYCRLEYLERDALIFAHAFLQDQE